MNKSIYCIGGATIDRKLTALGALEMSTSNPVKAISSFGGVARNVAENLGRLSGNIFLQCIVGDDAEGHHLLSYLQELDINTDACMVLKNHATAHYYAVLDQHGELYTAFIDMEIYQRIPHHEFTLTWNTWPNHSIVFLDTNLPSTLIDAAIQQSKNKQLKLCIDPVSTAKALRLPLSLEGVFLIKPNHYEASVLTNIKLTSVTDCMKAAHLLLDRGVQHVVISLGASGYVIANDRDQHHVHSAKIDLIKDVNGAGDAFMAGILFGLQQDSTILDACQLGAAAAAFTIKTHKTVADNITASCLYVTSNIVEEHSHAAIF